MNSVRDIVDRLERERTLGDADAARLLTCDDAEAQYLLDRARAVAEGRFGRRVYLRGLIEITNRCRNDCYYCGIRAGNRRVARYRLTADEIAACCRAGHAAGLRTFVLQGGEDPALDDVWLEELIARIKAECPDCAVTLSLGERPTASYERLFRAGADRYLLRHETRDEAHYARLHPASMSLANRLRCLDDLRRIGYQTGTGIMVGTPGQGITELLADIRYIAALRPQMIGLGPFLPQRDTPFAGCPAGSLERTLRLVALFRLLLPAALIPATTALASLRPDGRRRGILAGANVLMPNLSPERVRPLYALYDHKAAWGSEAAENLARLAEELHAFGYAPDFGRGDYRAENE